MKLNSKLTTFQGMRYKNWFSCVLISAICAIFMLLPDHISSTLVLNSEGLANGQLWRLFTGHFVHTNVWHFALNLAGLWLTWLLFFEHYTVPRIIFAILICTIGLSLVLLVTDNLVHMKWYAGLSGTLHGLFAFALALELLKKRMTTYLLIIFGTAKLLYEQMGGSTQSTADLIGANVAIDAHLWGAILGVLAGYVVIFVGRIKRK